jgi:hypothetical protein
MRGYLPWHGSFAPIGPDPDLVDAVAGAVPAALEQAPDPTGRRTTSDQNA